MTTRQGDTVVDRDEHPRADTSLEKLAALRCDIAIGVDQLDCGEGLEGERVFAELANEGQRG